MELWHFIINEIPQLHTTQSGPLDYCTVYCTFSNLSYIIVYLQGLSSTPCMHYIRTSVTHSILPYKDQEPFPVGKARSFITESRLTFLRWVLYFDLLTLSMLELNTQLFFRVGIYSGFIERKWFKLCLIEIVYQRWQKKYCRFHIWFFQDCIQKTGILLIWEDF